MSIKINYEAVKTQHEGNYTTIFELERTKENT